MTAPLCLLIILLKVTLICSAQEGPQDSEQKWYLWVVTHDLPPPKLNVSEQPWFIIFRHSVLAWVHSHSRSAEGWASPTPPSSMLRRQDLASHAVEEAFPEGRSLCASARQASVGVTFADVSSAKPARHSSSVWTMTAQGEALANRMHWVVIVPVYHAHKHLIKLVQ